MKKKLIFLFGIMLLLVIASNIIIKLSTSQTGNFNKQAKKIQIVTSFYPVYMIGVNLADQQDSIEVNSLTDLNTGCLHDYQLTTQDMKLIANADILIVNGGGMEGFLEDVTSNYPNLTIINASENITMLPANVAEHGVADEKVSDDPAVMNTNVAEHNVADVKDSRDPSLKNSNGELNTHGGVNPHGEWNAHVWLEPALYIQQIENVKAGMEDYIKKNNSNSAIIVQAIEKNAQSYIQKISALENELNKLADKQHLNEGQGSQKRKAVIFHDSFAYLADSAGMEIVDSIPLDSDTALSAGEIAEIVREVKAEDIKYLFTEEQYSDSIAKQIETETDAKVYIIDSAVTGDGSKDSYLNAMKKNIEVLRQALNKQ